MDERTTMNLNQPLDNSEGERALPPHEPTEKPYENDRHGMCVLLWSSKGDRALQQHTTTTHIVQLCRMDGPV